MAVLAPRIMRGITLVANDDINLAITLEEMTLPVMEEITETFHPGGADGEVDIAGLGTKALMLSAKVKGYTPEVFNLFGGPPGVRQDWTGKVLVTDDETGVEYEHAIDIKGRLTKIDGGNRQPGKAGGYDYEMKSIWTYTEYWNGQVLHRWNLKTGGWDIQNSVPVNSHRRSFLLS